MRRLLPLLALLLVPITALGQAKSERVSIKTVDGVDLIGNFYAGNKGTAPVVMLLHAYEKDSRSKDWISLAESLQKAGYAVLSFDFRGHGESTGVDPFLFWSNPTNKLYIKNPNPKR